MVYSYEPQIQLQFGIIRVANDPLALSKRLSYLSQ